jgi:hypothetical protein
MMDCGNIIHGKGNINENLSIKSSASYISMTTTIIQYYDANENEKI